MVFHNMDRPSSYVVQDVHSLDSSYGTAWRLLLLLSHKNLMGDFYEFSVYSLDHSIIFRLKSCLVVIIVIFFFNDYNC